MNKIDLIKQIAKNTFISKKKSQEIIKNLIQIITKELQLGNSVTLTGLGHFNVKLRAARKGRNLQTGEILNIAETKVPSFKPDKSLKQAIKLNHVDLTKLDK